MWGGGGGGGVGLSAIFFLKMWLVPLHAEISVPLHLLLSRPVPNLCLLCLHSLSQCLIKHTVHPGVLGVGLLSP